MSDLPTAREIPGTGEEIFFPRAPHADPVYEIQICGTLEFHFWHLSWWDRRRIGESSYRRYVDAFFIANAKSRFEHEHEWLLVNRKAVAFRQVASYEVRRPAEKLEAERGSHTYRFLIDDPGECVGIAFQARWNLETWQEATTEDRLVATVRVLPAGTSTLKARWATAKSATALSPTHDPRLEEEVRRQIRSQIELSAENRKVALVTILEKKEEMLAAINERANLAADLREQYLREVDDWEAGELMKLARSDGADGRLGKIIG